MAFNIVETLFNNYKQRFPEASMDNFLTYIKRNYPNQYNWAQRFVDSAQDYATGTIDDLKELESQAKQNIQKQANTVKTNMTNQTKIAQQKLEQALTKEGLKKAITATPKVGSTAKNIIKGGANAAKKATGGVIAGALDIPTTIGNWTREGANNLSRGLDVAGNTMTIASPYALKIPGWRGKVASGLLLGAGQGAHYLSDRLIDNNQQQPTPTTREIIEAGRLANQEANNLQAQARNQINQTQEAIDWYNNFDNRMSSGNYSSPENIKEMNMRLPAPPTTGVNTSGNINRPISNLPPLSGQSDASNQNNLGNINMSNQQPILSNNQQMVNVIDNIEMLSSFVRGMQSGNQLPNLGVSPEELQAYSNMLEQYGENISGLQQDVDAYRKALQSNVRNQAIAGALDGVGQILQATKLPKQNAYALVPGVGMVGYEAPQNTSNLQNLGQNLRNMNQAQLDAFPINMELQNSLRKAEQDRAVQFADLLTGTRLSNQTGLPLNIARNMSASDYIDYIQPTQEARNRAQELVMQGVADILTGGQQQAADYTKALDTQALENQGLYQREVLGQLGQNQRAQLDALVKTNLNELDNRTKLQLEQMSGMNAMQLERLKQSDPNAFYRAIGPVLMAATYTTGPSSNLAGNYIYTLLNQLYPQGGQQSGGMTPAAQSYWNNFNR